MFYQICSIISSRKWMEINLENFSGGSREGGGGGGGGGGEDPGKPPPPPLFLDQTEAQREKKKF